MNRALTLGFLAAVALALLGRLPQLGQRPLHTDESVQAYKFLGLWQHGTYRYDPNEYHGPALNYFSLPFAWLSGAKETTQLHIKTLRLVPAVFGLGLILLLPLFRDGMGRVAVFWAALFTALSPAFVYYSRYYIHEMLLVFFTLLLGAAAWRYWRRPSWGWALLGGLALGLMVTTKETFVFNLAAAAIAAGLTWWWERHADRPVGCPSWNWRHLVAGVGVAAVVWFVLFSSFFTNFEGPLDSFRTYLTWIRRAGGDSPHVHPWYFYFHRLLWFHVAKGPIWSEGLIIVLALVGVGFAFSRKVAALGAHGGWVRFVVFYTVALTGMYTVISYKTPWCLLSFFNGFILLAGVGVAGIFALLRCKWLRAGTSLVLVIASGQLAWQAWRGAFQFNHKPWNPYVWMATLLHAPQVSYDTDPRNPYVYAHTSEDLLRLVKRVKALAQTTSHPADLEIKVMAPGGDYWPLPWYFRGFHRVGYYSKVPAHPYAPIIIASTKLHADLDDKSDKKWLMTGLYQHRPEVFLELYVEFNLWKKFVMSRPRPKDD